MPSPSTNPSTNPTSNSDAINATFLSTAAAHKVLDPKYTFSEEKIRGIITSIISGGISGGINFGLTAAGLSSTLSAFLGLYLIGSILGYTFDILFAKKNFTIASGYNGQSGPYRGPVPYKDIITRVMWMLSSFVDKHFFRYVITVLIDTLIGIVILRAVIDFMNQRNFMMDFVYRDALVAGAISISTFILYNNVLRFDWAYSDTNDPTMNIMILMWSTLILVIFAISFNGNGHNERKNNQDIPQVWWDSLIEHRDEKMRYYTHESENGTKK